MNKKKSTHDEQENKAGWNKVLADAEGALSEAKTRVRQLKKVVGDLRLKVESGEPLPEYLKNASTQN